MLKDLELFLSSLVLFFSVIGIFNARFIVRKKLKSKNENRDVIILKIVGYIFSLISLLAIYYLK